MIGETLVTKQTGNEGRLVRKVMVADAVEIEHEYYLSLLMDRDTSRPVIVASTEGGMDIEEVAENRPEKIIKQLIHPLAGLQPYEVRKLTAALGFKGGAAKEFGKLLKNLYKLFLSLDCDMVEINPLVETKDGQVLALDAKFGFDDNALYRQRQVAEMKDENEYDPLELEAARHDLNYVKLDGNIGLMVNGAGLSMATMDIIKYYGGEAANFMDVAGAATPERVAAAFKLIYKDKDVKGILINIFGGMMRCNDIAQGLVNASKEVGLDKPLVVRLEGTNVEMGMDILNNSGFPIKPVETMEEAAQKVVEMVKE